MRAIGSSRRLRWVALSALGLFAAAPAMATVVIEHVTPFRGNSMEDGPFPGQTFDVEVRLHWDGQGSLLGVFTSTQFDSNALQFVGSTPPPAIILYTLDPETNDVLSGLVRYSTQLRQPGDPESVLRTVPYASTVPTDPSQATSPAGVLIRKLTFRIIGFGTGSIQGFMAPGDAVTGDDVVFMTTFVPEPGAAWLLGLGLMALARRLPRSGGARGR